VRARSPAETLARVRPLLRGFGITRVMAQEGLGDIKIPVSISCRPNSRFVSTSQGKGITRELADVSAIMESIEGFHAERLPPPSVIASTAELARAARAHVSPDTLPKIPVLRGHHPEEPIGWLPATRLADGAPVLVPRNFLCMDQTVDRAEEATWSLFVTTNGLASGNTQEEAIVHGLYELIERDCVHEHRFLRDEPEQMRRRVTTDSLRALPHIADLIRLLDEADMVLWVSAIHGRLDVPAFVAMVRPRALVERAVATGCGAHYVPEVALSRAITEAVQSRITYISGSRDDVMPWQYLAVGPPIEAPPEDGSPPFRFEDAPRPPRFESFRDVLTWTQAKLAEHGLGDACFFDHQRPDYGDIPVVSVVCPGLKVDLQIAGPGKRE
jgi:YcaO-like protein with predicted kinase domain